jgi:uncharacterized protein (TIGR02453 family)
MLQRSTLTFLQQLKKNNNKEWFEKNRKLYEAAKADYMQLVENVLDGLKKFDNSLAELQPKQCVFRINRDVRFSADKSPYKTNMGAGFSKGGKALNFAGYYFHCEPAQNFIGGGLWMPDAANLKKVRQEIDYNQQEFKSIVTNKPFVKLYKKLEDSKEYSLTRPPKGYDENNPALAFLKLKSFTAGAAITDAQLVEKKLLKNILTHFEAIKPLLDFLNRALEND